MKLCLSKPIWERKNPTDLFRRVRKYVLWDHITALSTRLSENMIMMMKIWLPVYHLSF